MISVVFALSAVLHVLKAAAAEPEFKLYCLKLFARRIGRVSARRTASSAKWRKTTTTSTTSRRGKRLTLA
jgi:hypothetical protein